METQYNGSCHCGAIEFTATVDLSKVSRCNCSVCTKHGLMGCLTKPENVVLVAGDPAVYEWGAKIGKRYFCRDCGTHCFTRGDLAEIGGPFAGVNVHALDGVDPFQLTPVYWDGRHDNWEAGPRSTPWPILRDTSAA
jgi:hypothetical protein